MDDAPTNASGPTVRGDVDGFNVADKHGGVPCRAHGLMGQAAD